MASPSSQAQAASIITAIGNAFKSKTGDPLPGDQIAQMLLQNMGQLGQLAKEGKLNQQQIQSLKEFADKHKGSGTPLSSAATSSAGSAISAAVAGPSKNQYSANGGNRSTNTSPLLSAAPAGIDTYPISPNLATTNSGPVNWGPAQQGRPTLSGGIAGGRIAGAPAQVTSGINEMLNLEDNRNMPRRKNTPSDQSMRRSIQDLVSSIDPSVKIESEVEDLLLDIADEFIDSVTNFGCRLAKHRGGDSLEVRDLQLHLERNHNIRIPGFSSDETRISMSQTSITPAAPAATSSKKGGAAAGQATHGMTLRSQRLAQVQQAKRESKLL